MVELRVYIAFYCNGLSASERRGGSGLWWSQTPLLHRSPRVSSSPLIHGASYVSSWWRSWERCERGLLLLMGSAMNYFMLLLYVYLDSLGILCSNVFLNHNPSWICGNPKLLLHFLVLKCKDLIQNGVLYPYTKIISCQLLIAKLITTSPCVQTTMGKATFTAACVPFWSFSCGAGWPPHHQLRDGKYYAGFWYMYRI